MDAWQNAQGGPCARGTCTNVGAVFPQGAARQKTLSAKHHFAEHGIGASDVKMDVTKMVARKDAVVKQNNDGILYLFKKQGRVFPWPMARL